MRYITKQSYAGCDPAHHWSIFVWAWVSPAGWANKLSGCEISSGETGFYLSGTRASAFPFPQHKIPDRGFSVPTAERKGECRYLLGCLHSTV